MLYCEREEIERKMVDLCNRSTINPLLHVAQHTHTLELSHTLRDVDPRRPQNPSTENPGRLPSLIKSSAVISPIISLPHRSDHDHKSDDEGGGGGERGGKTSAEGVIDSCS